MLFNLPSSATTRNKAVEIIKAKLSSARNLMVFLCVMRKLPGQRHRVLFYKPLQQTFDRQKADPYYERGRGQMLKPVAETAANP